MVEIYYGRAGSGKTNTLMQQLEAIAKNGQKVCLVVPEQLSLTREFYVNKSGVSGISVLSFSRLANTVFRALGKTAKKIPDNVMNACAVFCAVINCYNDLGYYKSIAYSHGFITSLISVFSEFDNNCINEQVVMSIPDGDWSARSKSKYRDLFMIYKEYKSLWQGDYKVPGGDISEAAELLELNDIFADTVFAFDGFFGFTAQQMLLINQILQQSPRCIFCFTTDFESDVFAPVTVEAKKIINECTRLKIKPELVCITDNGYSDKSDALKVLEKTAFESVVKEGKAEGGITVFGAKNISDELNFIACKIKNDVIDKKYTFSDIAVLCPDADSIKHMATAVFEKHGIPVFADSSKTLMSTQLCAFVTTALDIANGGFEYESVFAFLKTGLCGISFDRISLLENYVRMWKIRGNDWADEWTKNPNGIDSYDDKTVAERLKTLNQLKDKIYIPLKSFKDAVSKKQTGGEFLRAIYKLCTDFNVADNLEATAEQFYKSGSLQLYYEYTRIFGVFTSLLDSIYEMCADTVFSAKRFYDLFCISAMSVKISSRPARTNEVLFSGIGRVRAENKKCVYIPQMNAGVIPSSLGNKSLITEADKRVFARHNIQVSMDILSKAMREYFDFYYAATSSSNELVLSHSHFSMSGDKCEKSEYLTAIETALGVGEITAKDLPPEFYLVSVAGAQQVATENEQGIKQALKEISGVDFNLKSDDTTLSNQIVELLYSKNLRLSFSGMEEYISCPFKFFLNRGLRLKEQQEIEFDSSNIGTFVHAGLENLLGGDYDITNTDAVKDAVKKISQEYYQNELSDCNGLSPRFDYMFGVIKNSLEGTALSVVDEINNSQYKPKYFELDISEHTPPVELENGYTLALTGSIDRVDITDDGYAKIVDYKTGKQQFSYKNMYNGLSLQLPVYAHAVRSKEKGVKIGAMYYLKSGVAVPPKKSTVPLSDEAYNKELEKYYTRDGIFCADGDSMQKLDRRGKLFENVKDERLVSQSAIDSLIDFATDKIKSTGKGITSGAFDISPIYDNGAKTCDYCSFKNICGIDKKEHLKRTLQPVGEDFLGEN